MSTNRRQFLRYSLTVLGCCRHRESRLPAPCAPVANEEFPGRSGYPRAHRRPSGRGHSHWSRATLADGFRSPGYSRPPLDYGDRSGHVDGCGKCISACSKMHFIPPDRQWIKVLRMQDSEKTAPYFFPQPCYHCDNPPCTKVCPVDATFKRSDGIVLIDNDRCIGCRFCMAACPYGARSFNWGAPDDPPEAMEKGYSPDTDIREKIGTVEKCDFCPDMAEKGMLPACHQRLPMGANLLRR